MLPPSLEQDPKHHPPNTSIVNSTQAWLTFHLHLSFQAFLFPRARNRIWHMSSTSPCPLSKSSSKNRNPRGVECHHRNLKKTQGSTTQTLTLTTLTEASAMTSSIRNPQAHLASSGPLRRKRSSPQVKEFRRGVPLEANRTPPREGKTIHHHRTKIQHIDSHPSTAITISRMSP
jgi:hypothetical protein